MYQDDGYMKILSNEEVKKLERIDVPKLFYVGQILEVNSGWFKVKSIGPRKLILKSIPKPEAR